MAATEIVPERDFWAVAPELFALAADIGAELESSHEVSNDLAEQVRRLANAIPDTPDPLGEIDPYLRSALLTGVIHALLAAESRDRRELRVLVERVRQALRDLLDEHPVWRSGPKHAAVWMREQGIPASEIARLLGISETSVRRWSNPEDESAPTGENASRVIVIAKVVNHLRHAMTARGTVQWLQRPHPALDDRKPIDELKDPDSYSRLVYLASGARSFVST